MDLSVVLTQQDSLIRSEPLVSVIVPVYKVEPYLRKCVDSILSQSYTNLDIILVDDGSPDGSPAICDEYAKKDGRVRVIHKENGGLSDARNAGVKAIKGEWFLFVDSDDYLERNAVEHFIGKLKQIGFDADIAVGVVKEIGLNGDIVFQRHTNLDAHTVYSAKEYIVRSTKRKQFFAPAWLNLYKTEFWYKFKHSFKIGIYYEDLDLIPRVFLSAKNVLYTDYAFYNYVKREGSITISGNRQKSYESAKIVLEDIFEMIQAVSDKKLRNVLCRYFSNIYLAMIGNFQIFEKCYPKGCSWWFLLLHCFDCKNFIKTLILGLSQKAYVGLYRRCIK